MKFSSTARIVAAGLVGATGLLAGVGAVAADVSDTTAVEVEVAAELVGVWKGPSGLVYAVFEDGSLELLGWS